MMPDSKLGRRMALKKKIEEEYRLAEERRNALHIRKHMGYQIHSETTWLTEDQNVEKRVGVNSEEHHDTLEVSKSDPPHEDTEEAMNSGNDAPSEQFEKRQLVVDLELIINKKETIILKLEEYKKKRKDVLGKDGIKNVEKDALVIETEERLLQIQSSIDSLVDDLNKFR
jgi:hypothetical protein